ncbi:MAG TPA: DUF2726 domain-containing protein [Phycisphaerales bacterium]|nr:DUF2726 domain-containing protein [Phycisphaerales bacterium]
MVYLLWALALLAVAMLIAVAMAVVRKQRIEREASEERRRRFSIPATGERIPLAPEKPAQPPVAIAEINPPLMPERVEPPGPAGAAAGAPPMGRLVNTPDGEMILTTPPFKLREAIFRPAVGRFVNGLSRRLPAWVIVCPRVRLDTLIVPTKPKIAGEGDAADWRDWRRRVRVRALDLVLCDRRTWRPLVAVLFDLRKNVDARAIAGGQDRMIDEVLNHVGLPLLHLTGDIVADWPLIQPYVEESILHHLTDEELLDASNRAKPIDGDGAVTLLRMDQEKGWVLE